jgi:hypothetical protein
MILIEEVVYIDGPSRKYPSIFVLHFKNLGEIRIGRYEYGHALFNKTISFGFKMK